MSHDHDVQPATYAFSGDAADLPHQAPDDVEPETLGLDECPVCGQPGTAARRELGAGTTIRHPRRVYPCSTTTPLEDLRVALTR